LDEKIIVYTDGGSRGNPGPAAAAFVLTNNIGKTLQAKGFFLERTTNNVAEYTAVLKALQAAKQLGAATIQVFSDSELVVRQVNGQYRVKSERLKRLYKDCLELLETFSEWKIEYITRDKNKKADALTNRVMDLERDIEDTCDNSSPRGKPVRLGILLSGGGRTMLNIKKQIDAGRLNAEIVVVISSRSTAKGVERANAAGLKVEIVRKKDYPDIEQFSNRLEKLLDSARVDLIVQAGWLCLWRIPEQYTNKVMNIHPALLPSFGGTGMWGHHVHEAVLKAGCKVSGCTVHFCTNQYDKGPIILQRCCEVRDDDDADTLAARVFEQECLAYPEAIRLFSENRIFVDEGIVKIQK